MAASIIRLEQELEDANARIAVLEEQARILVAERDEARADAGEWQNKYAGVFVERDEAREALKRIAGAIFRKPYVWETRFPAEPTPPASAPTPPASNSLYEAEQPSTPNCRWRDGWGAEMTLKL